MPRNLITVVLAFEVAQQRGAGMAFVPGLAFAVILTTNAMLVLASFRARRSALVVTEPAPQGTNVAFDALPAAAAPAPPGTRRRFVLNAVMLVMLAVGGVVLWYGS